MRVLYIFKMLWANSVYPCSQLSLRHIIISLKSLHRLLIKGTAQTVSYEEYFSAIEIGSFRSPILWLCELPLRPHGAQRRRLWRTTPFSSAWVALLKGERDECMNGGTVLEKNAWGVHILYIYIYINIYWNIYLDMSFSEFLTWLGFVVVRMVLITSNGYIHPDEFFQSPEPIAGTVIYVRASVCLLIYRHTHCIYLTPFYVSFLFFPFPCS